MPTPVVIVPFSGFEGSGTTNGPWQDSITGDIYSTMFDPGTFIIHMYRSTDAGLTWAPQDDGGAPTAVGFANNSPVVYDDAARTITMLMDPDPTFVGLMTIIQFSTATNTWGAAQVSPNYVSAGITFDGFDHMVLRTGGDYVIFFGGFDGFGTGNCYFTTWNPIGGWLAVQVFLAPQIDDIPFAAVAAGARVHVFSTLNMTFNLLHRTIHSDNSFTVTDLVAVDVVGTGTSGGADFGCTATVIDFNVGLNQLTMGVLTGTGAFHSLVATEAETPVWVETDLGQTWDPGTAGFIFTNTVALSVGALVFVYRIMGPSPFTIVQVEIGGATTTVLGPDTPRPNTFNVALVSGAAASVFDEDSAGGISPNETAYVLFGGSPPPPTPISSALNAIGVIAGGTAQDVIPIIPERRLRRASQLLVDLQPSQNSTDLWIEIALRGVKLYRKGAHYHVDRSQRWRVKEFTYPTILPAGAPGTTFLKQTVVLDSDCAFLLYSVYSTQIVVAGYSFKFYGPNGEDLEYCLAYAGSAGPQPSLIGGGNTVGTSRRPRTFDPPVEYPPAGAITFDYRIPNPAPPNDSDRPMYLCFTGLRLYGRF